MIFGVVKIITFVVWIKSLEAQEFLFVLQFEFIDEFLRRNPLYGKWKVNILVNSFGEPLLDS